MDRARDAEPTIRPNTPSADQQSNPFVRPRGAPGSRQGLIPIDGSGAPVAKSNGKADPYSFWMHYYRTNDATRTDPERLRETVQLLNQSGKVRDVHAALLGYLTNHPDHAEAWMYEALALAIEMNKGSTADAKTALNYAVDLAQRSHNPNHLVSVADMLMLKGYFERVGPLLDEAAAKVPHRNEPLLMSVNLAQKTKDVRRMAETIDRLLSLGWPGQDDYIRTESRNQAEILAKALREDGHSDQADDLLAKVTNSEARDLFVRLTWDGDADYDLTVEEPLGATATYETPRTVFGGSVIKNGYASHPEEVYVCPRAFDGDYTVSVNTIWTNPGKPVTRLTLEAIAHEGTNHEQKQVYNLTPDRLYKPIVVHVSGGRRKSVLPFNNPAAAMAEAQTQIKKNPKTGKGTRGLADKPASSTSSQPRQSSHDGEKPRF
jgi:hypothetical protein